MKVDDLIEYFEHVQGKIEMDGFAVQGVFSDRVEGMFAYTVGLDPELIITGMNPGQAAALLNTAFRTFELNEERPAPGRFTGIIERFEVELVEVRADHPTFGLNVARGWRTAYDRPTTFAVLQLLWPDDSGRFPNERRYDRDRFPQPLIGVK